MRPKRNLREVRRAHLVAGAMMLAIPASAVALTVGAADARSAIQISVVQRHIDYGQALTITGNASPANAGQKVVLEFARTGGGHWRAIDTARVGPHGHFAFKTPVRQSGLVRALSASSTAARARLPLGSSAAIAPSPARRVQVTPRFRVRDRSINVLGGQSVTVDGRLLPEVGGRRITLETRSGRHWHAVTSTRTGSHGGFRLRYTASGLGSHSLRVRFAGDRLNTRAARGAGKLTVFRQSVASWYYDGGATACGFHAGYGVANRTLPCGTKVTFSYGGRTVTATVDDRGPFVGGREWDLNQNTAAALGFGGVATVWSTA
jgi:rare lipoprotein A